MKITQNATTILNRENKEPDLTGSHQNREVKQKDVSNFIPTPDRSTPNTVEHKITHTKPKILHGVRSWLKSLLLKEKSQTLKQDTFECFEKAVQLFSETKKPGDVLVLTFDSLHSAVIVCAEINKPVYLSYGSERTSKYDEKYFRGANDGKSEADLAKDMVKFNCFENLYKTKLEKMDCNKMLDEWNSIIETKSFNRLTHNCSHVVRNLLKEGVKEHFNQSLSPKFEHDRSFQMPKNTQHLALEINNKMPPSKSD